MPQADLGTLPMVILPILLMNFSHPVARPLRHAKFLPVKTPRLTWGGIRVYARCVRILHHWMRPEGHP